MSLGLAIPRVLIEWCNSTCSQPKNGDYEIMIDIAGNYYIVNEFDRPYKRLVTIKIGDLYYYSDPILRKEYGGLSADHPTSLKEFGFEALELEYQVNFKRIRDSTAKYKDGTLRPWQGEDEFSLLLEKEMKHV